MKCNYSRWCGLALLLVAGCALAAAPDPAEHKLFEQVEARAEKGDADAQLQLGSMYARGEGVEKSLVKAAKWHRKAAEAGLARAQLILSMDLTYGRGVKADPVESVRWMRKAADQKLADAQFDLGLAYANGEGVAQNSVEAVKWFRLAAAQNMADAACELGRCYFDGTGVPTDPSQGITWTTKAAQQGFASAQNRLGLCYTKGEGVATNYIEAYKWFSLAAAQDDEHADEIRVSLAKITPLMTPEQITEAQHLARDFEPGQTTRTNTAPAATSTVPPPSPPVSTGSVSVTAASEGCEVFVDGSFVGNAPAKLKLSAGAHTIEVKKTGFKDYRRELTVGPEADLTLRADLLPQ